MFQGRYKALLVDPVEWGLELSRYIHLNPIRVKALALGKLERAAGRMAAGEKPSKEIVQERLEKLRKYQWSSYRCYAGRQRVPGWPSWDQLVKDVVRIRGLSWDEMRLRRGDWGRDLMWYLGRKLGGMKLRELGERAGGIDYATVSAGIKRMERRLATDTKLRHQVQAVMAPTGGINDW